MWTLPKAAEQNGSTALRQALDNNGEELLWVAEVMTGSRQAGEQCLAEAVELAKAARYVGREWMLSWLRRVLVHVALTQTIGEIHELLLTAGARMAVTPARAWVNACDRQELRCIPPERIINSFDVLERACLVLYAYLGYSAMDCALLLGCPRGWIGSICESVLTRFIEVPRSTQNSSRDVDAFVSPGVTECTH